MDVVWERASAEEAHLRQLYGIEGPVDEALVALRLRPALARRLLPVDPVRLGRASRGRREGDRLSRRQADVGDALLDRRAEDA